MTLADRPVWLSICTGLCCAISVVYWESWSSELQFRLNTLNFMRV
jgi:hypothetical protein